MLRQAVAEGQGMLSRKWIDFRKMHLLWKFFSICRVGTESQNSDLSLAADQLESLARLRVRCVDSEEAFGRSRLQLSQRTTTVSGSDTPSTVASFVTTTHSRHHRSLRQLRRAEQRWYLALAGIPPRAEAALSVEPICPDCLRSLPGF